MLARYAVAIALLGCHSSPTPAPPPATSDQGSSVPAPAPTPAPTGPSFGETCGANDACAPGLECIAYLGVAGARGPQFKTCEQRCDDAKPCPTGKACHTIADGPGRVCR
jgi:hypothetical protein